MKKIKLLLAIVIIGSLQSCCFSNDCEDDPIITEPDFVSAYEPITIDREAIDASVQLLPPKPIVDAGKIYVLNNLLFVNEKNGGFHVFQNEDPSNPTPINFIEILGSSDISIRNGVYYANQAVDLIAIVYNARSSELTISKRIEDVFPVIISPDGFYPNVEAGQVVIGWRLKS